MKSTCELTQYLQHTLKGVIIQVWILLIPFIVYSQKPYYRNYTTDDGLAGNVVYRVLQDSKGYIWFATETGVSRFDGKGFENYTVDDGLSANEVLRLFEDSKGRIWFPAYSGKLSYYLDGEIFNMYNDSLVKKICFSSYIKAFLVDKAGNLWLTNSNDVIKIDKHNQIVRIKSAHKITGLWEDNMGNIRAVAGNLYVDLSGRIILKSNYTLTSSTPIIQLDDGSILISTDRGIVNYKDNKESLLIPATDELTKETIANMVMDNEGFLWLCTNNGAVMFKKEGVTLKKTAVYLDDKIITSVLHDNENNYWFTTIGEGVFFIPSINVMSYTIDDGLPGNTIYSLAEDDDGNIWMGFDDLRYGIIKDNEFFMTQLVSYQPALRKRITNIITHSDGSVWLAGDGGVFRISENDTSIIYPNTCKYILEGKKNNVWLSTIYGTVSFNMKNEAILKNPESKDEFIRLCINKERTHALCFDTDDNLLLGTNNGLKIFDGDTVLCYPYDDPLLKRRITGIQLSKKGAIWFSTYGWGIGVLKNDSLITLTIEDGLTGNICNSLYLDDDGNGWAATNKGLNKISFFSDSTIEIKNFTTRDGLVFNDINAVYKKGDTVWVATAKGLSYFAESNMNQSKPPPKIYITKFQVSDIDRFLTNNNNTFPYSFNNISIEYAGISFYSQGDVLYKYKLTGPDTSWNYTRSTIVEYPSLLPGEYQFIVNAANADGIWSIEPEQISFIIEKPFWLKWWFLLLEALGLSLLISIVIYYVIVRINIREQKKLSIRMKLAEAEQKALRAQMNPHFIFNSLNTIQRFIIENDKKTAYVYLEKFGSLIRKTLENSRERSIPVKKELETLELYLELEKKRFEEKFDYVFDVDPQIDTNNIMIPPMIFQPIVENAIKHGIMPGKTKGKIVIGVKKGKGKIICSVKDNGIGRKKAASLNANQLKQHKSLGLQITQERIELFSSTLQDDQTMNITDLKNDTGESAGTLVEINIPVDYEL